MNIMFLSVFPMNPDEGGVQRVSDVLAREFLRRGHHVIYLCYQYRPYLNKYDYPAKQYFVDENKVDKATLEDEICKIVEENSIEYVLSQNIEHNHILKLMPKHVKIISTLHVQPFALNGISRKRIWRTNSMNARQFVFKLISLIYPKFQENFFGRYQATGLLEASKYSNKICFLSDNYIDRALKHVPAIDRSMCCAVGNPNSFDIAKINIPEYTERENLIIWVGRVTNAQKNTIDFLRMWKYLYKKNPTWRAIVIGNGEDFEYDKKYISSNKLERIEMVGQRRDVDSFYKRAKIMAMTSYGEGFPMVVNESMAYGCVPCVYDTFESLHEIVTDDFDGMIIPNVSPKEMAARIQSYIDNEERLCVMSVNAHESVKEFSVDNVADKWEEILEKL